jgi:predicted AAA+ superfamily ATPase
MPTSADYLPRKAATLVSEALSDTRIVVINGARQAGKSTLARTVSQSFPRVLSRSLDRPAQRNAAISDPEGFLIHDGLMVIDEVQRVPDLWLAMKAIVDEDPRPGQFLLTGSARLLALSSLPDALPGRTETIELWPLSQGEIDGFPDGFVDAAFSRGADLIHESPVPEVPSLTRTDYFDRTARGGYPDVVRRDLPRRRSRLLASYLSDMVSRDVHQVAQIQRSERMQQLLQLLAGQVAGILNVSRLSSDLGLDTATLRNYLSILETIFVIKRLPAYAPSQLTRATAAPKITFVDSGLATHLGGGLTTGSTAGNLLENFVLGEIGRQLTWCEPVVQLFHYRDRDQHEVDAVLEDLSGRVVGIEVKAALTVRPDDFRGLRVLRDRLGDRFQAGFVLYCGQDRLSFGGGLGCLPISALWTTSP